MRGRLAAGAAALWWREVVRFVRQPSRLVGALATPLLFWLLVGSGMGRSFAGAEDEHYLEYFFPGALLLLILFTAIFSTISVIEDRREGFLQGVLVSPVPRGAIVLGKLLGGATLAAEQGLLFLLAAPLAGLGLEWWAWPAAAAAMFGIGFALTGLGFWFAWRIESVQGFHAVMNLVLMPAWLLSGALFPPSGAHPVVGTMMLANPLFYCLEILRPLLSGQRPGAMALGAFAGFAVAIFVLCWSQTCRKTSRPV